MPVKLTQVEFITRAKQKYPLLDYSVTIYSNATTKIKVRCPKHGEFEQLPFNHLKGGCPICGIETRNQKQTLDTTTFIERANNVHKGKYDYSKVNYQGFNSKINIICPQHGVFEQRANNHLAGCGCLKCGKERQTRAKQDNKESFIKKLRLFILTLLMNMTK